jgi:DNA-binding NtrC family response regulator
MAAGSNGSSTKKRVLVIDDESTQLRIVEGLIQKEGYPVTVISDGQLGIDYLLGAESADVGAVVLDLSMPRVSGFDVLKAVRPKRPRLPIIVLTAHASLSNAAQCMRAGASDFLVKPANGERLRTALATAMNETIPDGELKPLTEKMGKTLRFDQLVGKSAAFQSALSLARRAAAATIPVLIEGESGVGKELIAQSVHSASPRKEKPFVVVNCGAIPQNLVESILFGHEKGAFTGAVDRHVGKFAEADGGTIFLDEIGELPLDAQVKLLRVLQEGEVEPVGGRQPVKVDVRVISATNRTLADEALQGRFREDLYYRLNVITITMPSLRERREDISDLARHFIERIASTEGVKVRGVSAEAQALLESYDWPGNVRQLQNAIFRAVVLSEGDELTLRDFPQLLTQAQRSASAAANGQSNAAAQGGAPQAITLLEPNGHVRPFNELEADIIRMSISRYRGHISEVARRLGIGRSTLYRKLAELGIDQDDVRERA